MAGVGFRRENDNSVTRLWPFSERTLDGPGPCLLPNCPPNCPAAATRNAPLRTALFLAWDASQSLTRPRPSPRYTSQEGWGLDSALVPTWRRALENVVSARKRAAR